jgi:hypothetical protein
LLADRDNSDFKNQKKKKKKKEHVPWASKIPQEERVEVLGRHAPQDLTLESNAQCINKSYMSNRNHSGAGSQTDLHYSPFLERVTFCAESLY